MRQDAAQPALAADIAFSGAAEALVY